MFTVSTSFDLNRTTLQRMLRLPDGIVYRHMERRVRRVENEVQRRAPGSMATGIRVQIRPGPNGDFQGVIRSTHHATVFVLYGTGVHGPTGQRITPRHTRALRFTVGGRVVFATSVAGQKPNNFLLEGLRAGL